MLAELLELLHTAEDRWTSLQADLSVWKDRDGLDAAADRASAAFLGAPAAGRPPGSPHSGDSTGTEEATLSVTATSRRAVRVERTTDGGRDLLVVDAGGGVLQVDPQGVADTEPNPHRSVAWIRLELLAPMLAPAILAGACRLQVTGATVVAGRECIAAVAVLRPETVDLVHNLLGYGVRRVELAVDRATGVVLRMQATDDDGRPLHRVEARSVRYDAPVDDALFSLEPPPGTTSIDQSRSGPVTIQEAARLVPFTLFAPPAGQADYPWSALVTPALPGRPATVHLHQLGMRRPTGRRMTFVVQTTDPVCMPEVTDWQPVRIGDLDAHTWTGERSTHLAVWRDGTGVWIRDADSPEAAAALLRSMQPVSTA
jgi:hypothetical protein